MRLFGYILIVFNLAAAGAFVYFGTKDYRARQQIQASALRHLLILQGLPLDGQDFSADDETPFQIEMAGGYRTETVSKKLLETYFKANTAAAPEGARLSFATQTPVTNQLAEVRRVYAIVTEELKARNEDVKKATDALANPDLPKAKVEERKKVHDAYEAAVAARLANFATWLLYQAESLEERIAIQGRLDRPAREFKAAETDAEREERLKRQAQDVTDAADLEARLKAKFDAVLAAPDGSRTTPVAKLPNTKVLADDLARLNKGRQKLVDDKATPDEVKAQDAKIAAKRKELDAAAKECQDQLQKVADQRAGGTQDPAERRVRIAHLLVHLDRDAAWQKRVVVIVGLRRYVGTVLRQAQRFREMALGVERFLPNDQAGYVALEADLRDSAIRNFARKEAVADLRVRTGNQLKADKEAIARRITDINDLKDQLQKVKDEVGRLLVQQSDIEQQLFEIQREVGLTLDEIYRLEELLKATERERYDLTPSRP